MTLKDVKSILTAIVCFALGATAGSFYETTNQKIQSQKEKNSKVTAKECREIFDNFVKEHDSDLELDPFFEGWFDEILKISEMTPDEYYKYIEDIYERSMYERTKNGGDGKTIVAKRIDVTEEEIDKGNVN
ncbi:MAG: hypothetical protein K2H82_02580 [Oscillospiraceae bacterium]|nr:hypothetical protein [Oscillospiraceae bacterium]